MVHHDSLWISPPQRASFRCRSVGQVQSRCRTGAGKSDDVQLPSPAGWATLNQQPPPTSTPIAIQKRPFCHFSGDTQDQIAFRLTLSTAVYNFVFVSASALDSSGIDHFILAEPPTSQFRHWYLYLHS